MIAGCRCSSPSSRPTTSTGALLQMIEFDLVFAAFSHLGSGVFFSLLVGVVTILFFGDLGEVLCSIHMLAPREVWKAGLSSSMRCSLARVPRLLHMFRMPTSTLSTPCASFFFGCLIYSLDTAPVSCRSGGRWCPEPLLLRGFLIRE